MKQEYQKISSLPILLNKQKILLIGGGKVALQKAKILLQNNIQFFIISIMVIKELKDICKNIILKEFEINDIKDEKIIIDASANDIVLKKLLKYKKNNSILLNIVDKPKFCDFYFMALTKNNFLQIAVTSNGISPSVSQFYRDKFQKELNSNLDDFLFDLKVLRKKKIIDINKTKTKLNKLNAKVYLIGCGLGDIELLTIKAYKIIKSVDVVLYDNLISKEIINIINDDTIKIYVGKKKSYHSKSQDEINKLLYKYVNDGLNVARLKSGDPFIFGRGAEEFLYLKQKGINTIVIPGISSAISAPLMANIPVTVRNYANSFTVVTAHLKSSLINLNWIHLLNMKNHTIIVLMGLTCTREILNESKKQNIDLNINVAIISNASRHNQEVYKFKLSEIELISKKASRPGILVFGNVINYLKI